MSDLIRRQDAIDAINAVFPVDPNKSEYASGIACGAALALTYIKQLPSAQQWIPCSERLPEDDNDVLVQMSDYSMMVDYRSASSSGWFWAEKNDLPIAWMPLPEPYREG